MRTDFFDGAMEAKLLNLHTCYLAKVIAIGGDVATVQPLSLVKQYGKAAKRQAPVPDVPIASHCKGRIIEKELKYVSGVADHAAVYGTEKILQFEPLKAGDVVICVCGERDITEAKKGNLALPTNRRHDFSDSMIIGVL